MVTTKSVSNEILGLFDTIRKQSSEYARVFELLAKKSYDLDSQRQAAYESLLEFKRESFDAVQDYTSKVENTLSDFRSHTQEVSVLYGHLSRIQSLENVLTQLNSSLDGKSKEVDEILQTLKEGVKRDITNEVSRIESRVSLKIHEIEDLVSLFDTKLYSMQEFHKREMTQLGEEIDRFKNKITETKYIVEESTKLIHESVAQAESELKLSTHKAIEKIDEKIEMSTKNLKDVDQLNIMCSQLRKDVAQLRTTTSQANLKSINLIWLAIVSSMCAIGLTAYSMIR